MNASLANHVVNKGDIIYYIAQRRNSIAKHLPGFAIGFKIPNGFKPRAKPVLKRFDFLTEVGTLTMLLDEFWFVIEKINMASSTRHEKLDDPLSLGRVMRKPLKATNASFIKRITKCRLISEQASKSNTAQAAAGIPKHLASVHAGIIKV